MRNLSRRHVNDSDPLETLADRRGTETLPSTHSFSPCRADVIEEFNEELRIKNYVTTEGEWQRLGRGEKQRLITPKKNNNKRRRLLRKDKRQMGSTTLLCPPMNIRSEESSIETSPVRQERLTAAHLQHESTARVRGSRGREIARASTAAREVISTAAAARRRRRCCRPRAIITSNQSTTTAYEPRLHPAVPDSGDISVSVDGSMQSDNSTSPETPIQHRIPDTTPMEKNERAEAITTGKKKNHKHRFRRKKLGRKTEETVQKNRRPSGRFQSS